MSRSDRGRFPLTLALAVALAGSALRADPDPAPRTPSAGRGSLRVDAPAPDERVTSAEPLVHVRGRVGAELFDADVVIALDASNSALLASGIDLDGDGVVGVTRPFAEDAGRVDTRHGAWTSDPDDSILLAELAGAHAMVDALGQRRDRVGVLTYTAHPTLRAAVGAPDEARRALDAVEVVEDPTGTDVARALRAAAELLGAAPRGGPGRARAILLCSDGEPTVPQPRYTAKQRALRGASELAAQGITLYVLAFGAQLHEPKHADDLEFLRALAEAGGGPMVEVDAPARLLEDLPPAHARPPALAVDNATSGAAARSLRLAPDGVFDALLPLVPGSNEVRVRASWGDGRDESLTRTVHYEGGAAPAVGSASAIGTGGSE